MLALASDASAVFLADGFCESGEPLKSYLPPDPLTPLSGSLLKPDEVFTMGVFGARAAEICYLPCLVARLSWNDCDGVR
jgi:hypothetical protein